MSRDIFSWIRLLRAPSNLAWNVPRDGASTTSLGNLVPGAHHPHGEEFLPYTQSKSPLFEFKTITPCPVTSCVSVLASDCSFFAACWLKAESQNHTESQHGRGWQGPLWVTQPNPLPKQGHPEQAAQHHVQTDFQLVEGKAWGS